MNAERLLAHYHEIADAPDAIARLRRFILDLAIRGKLVPQEAGDEPASELLKRIGREKALLVKAGEIGDKPSLPAVVNADMPFSIPSTWEWVRFANIVDFSAGRTPSRNDTSFWNTGDHAWVSIADMEDGQILTATKETVSDKARERVFGAEPEAPGTILMSFKLTIGKIARLGVPAFHNEAIISIRPHVAELDAYLFKILPQFARQGDTKGAIKGATLNRDSISNILFPLPPLDEQHRIVAKVDELMALCDQLEAAQGTREAVRNQLAAASLARLNAPDPETFQDDARFALDALPALTTRPDQISQFRQTIFDLAVRGKLVPQDASDEPISAALQSAMARRAALVKAKKVRAKKLDGFDKLEADTGLPSSWVVERLGNLVDPRNTISYGVLVPGEEVPDGIPFVRVQDLALSGHPARPNKTISSEIEKAYARTRLRGGEILVCVVGATIGKLGIVPRSWAGANIARAVARILPIPEILREYLLIVMRGEPVQAYFTATTRTLAQPTLNVGLIEQTPIPLPPLAEQHRIVAKVDELMALCDRLEASLTATAATRRRLLDALLAEAFAPAEGRELEAAE
jgi:type I restriction enzyme S subunit